MNWVTETSRSYVGYRTTLYYESITPGEYRQLTFVDHESPECPQEGLNTLEERKNRHLAFLDKVKQQLEEVCPVCYHRHGPNVACESHHC
jgi:hypothetical protein